MPTATNCGAETRCLAACVCDQLLATDCHGHQIRGIYLTGSNGQALVDSTLDYVLEVSDIDMHVSFRDDISWRKHLDTVPRAVEVQAAIEACFAKRCPRALHRPRPQLLGPNQLMAEHPGFVYSPQSTIVVLHDEAYPKDDYSNPDTIRRHNAADLIERAEFVQCVPLLAIGRPWTSSRDLLSQLTWRISPVGPLALHLSGLDTRHVWTLNRTQATAALDKVGRASLADPYRAFYLSGCDFFLSGFTDTTACRATIASGTHVLTEGAGIAHSIARISNPNVSAEDS